MADAVASGVRDDRNVCRLCGALENLSLCGGCRETWYCCKDHQRAHWKEHKRKCKRSRSKKSVEATEGASGSDSATGTVGVDTTSVTFSIPCISYAEIGGTNNANAVHEFADKQEDVSVEVLTAADVKRQECTNGSTSPLDAVRRLSTDKRFEQLPTIAEEGSGDRIFIETSFSQTFRSSRHTARARRSANAMSPKGSTMDNKDTYIDVLKSRFSAIAEYVVRCLNTYGICVLDGFLGEATGKEILSEVKELRDLGVFRKGQLVSSASSATDMIRGDIITWVDGRGQVCENIQFLVSCMDAVVQNCSALMEGYKIIERTKAMVACYPGCSTGYVRHIDNPNGDGRFITCIYYLNQNWDVRRDGGMLRIYPEGKDTVANIEPTLDRLLFFWSDRRNPHEVLPSARERYAITVWYYEAEERARALKRFKTGEVNNNPKKQAVPLSLFNSAENHDDSL